MAYFVSPDQSYHISISREVKENKTTLECEENVYLYSDVYVVDHSKGCSPCRPWREPSF